MEKRIGSMVLVKHVEWRWEYRPPYQPLTPEQKVKAADAYTRMPQGDLAAMRQESQERLEGLQVNYLSGFYARYGGKDTSDVPPSFSGLPLFDALGWVMGHLYSQAPQ